MLEKSRDMRGEIKILDIEKTSSPILHFGKNTIELLIINEFDFFHSLTFEIPSVISR